MKMSVIRSTVHNYTCIIGCGILHKFRISWHVMKAIRIFFIVSRFGVTLFSANPSHRSPSFFFFRIHYMDSPNCLLLFLSISVFYFVVFFCFYTS